jgi:hypothetical protein
VLRDRCLEPRATPEQLKCGLFGKGQCLLLMYILVDTVRAR